MKLSHNLAFTVLLAGFAAVPCGPASAQTDRDAIAVVRSIIKADRQAVVTEALQLTENESEAFWPLYHQYRAEMDKVGDGLTKLVQEYAEAYPNVPEERASQMLKDLAELEKKKVATRGGFLKKFGRVIPASKNVRFAQIENRLDLALQLKLASEIPLMPVEGRLRSEASGAAAVVAEGVPGGAVVQVRELNATVVAIHKASRNVTLMSEDGIKQTVKVGPDAIDFEQIQVGDRLKVEATQELVVEMAEPGESTGDGAAAVVVLAPKGAKPGGVMAETTQVTATVTALDQQRRTATLRFEDGSTKTFPVRGDVDLGKRKVGEKVVFSVTEMIAIKVQKP